MVDADAGVDAGAVLQGHEGVVGSRRAERDDGAPLRHALDDRAAGEHDGGDSLGDHLGTRSATSASLRTRPVASHSLHRR